MGHTKTLGFTKENELAKLFSAIGGEYYTNCFTPSPDTTRSLAAAFSGSPSHENGCSTRIRFARHFLKEGIDDMFSEMIRSGYKVNIFHEPEERDLGIFPTTVYSNCYLHEDYNLEKYIQVIKDDRSSNRCDYIGISDFHQVYNDYGYNQRGARKALAQITKTLRMVVNRIDINSYDHCFFFSDHGFRISGDLFNPAIYLGEERTNVVMLHRTKSDTGLRLNNKLCSIMSLCASICNLVNSKAKQCDFPLWDKREIEHIVVQDHFNYQPRVMQNIDYWGVIKKEKIYSRTLQDAYTLIRKSGRIIKGINYQFEKILAEETSLKDYISDYEAVKRQIEFAEKESKHIISHLATGELRQRSKFKRFRNIINRMQKIKTRLFFILV